MSEQMQNAVLNPQHEKRVKEAKRQKKKSQQPAVLEEWYCLVNCGDKVAHGKKGHKVLRKRLTENGVTSDFLGWEKKGAAQFIAKAKKDKTLKTADYKPERTIVSEE